MAKNIPEKQAGRTSRSLSGEIRNAERASVTLRLFGLFNAEVS